jgi:hypothetical protein
MGEQEHPELSLCCEVGHLLQSTHSTSFSLKSLVLNSSSLSWIEEAIRNWPTCADHVLLLLLGAGNALDDPRSDAPQEYAF